MELTYWIIADLLVGAAVVYLLGAMFVSLLHPPGSQIELLGHSIAVVATAAFLTLLLFAAGLSYASTFQSVFARWCAVPTFFAVASILWVAISLITMTKIASGSGRQRYVAFGLLAAGMLPILATWLMGTRHLRGGSWVMYWF